MRRPQEIQDRAVRVSEAHSQWLHGGDLPSVEDATDALADLTRDIAWPLVCLQVLIADEPLNDLPSFDDLFERIGWRVGLSAARRRLTVLDANWDAEAVAEAEEQGGELSDAKDRRQVLESIAWYEERLR